MVTLARELSGLIVKLTNPAPSGPPDVLIALPGPIGPPGGRTQSLEVQRSTSTTQTNEIPTNEAQSLTFELLLVEGWLG